jgi:hypothetical protein
MRTERGSAGCGVVVADFALDFNERAKSAGAFASGVSATLKWILSLVVEST